MDEHPDTAREALEKIGELVEAAFMRGDVQYMLGQIAAVATDGLAKINRPEPSVETMRIEAPLVIMFQAPDKNVITHLHPGNTSYQEYGLLIVDLVRHVANAFNVEADSVWKWVDKERHHHTTNITRPS